MAIKLILILVVLVVALILLAPALPHVVMVASAIAFMAKLLMPT